MTYCNAFLFPGNFEFCGGWSKPWPPEREAGVLIKSTADFSTYLDINLGPDIHRIIAIGFNFSVITVIVNVLLFGLIFKCDCCWTMRSVGADRAPHMIYARVNVICGSGQSHPSIRSGTLRLCLCLHVVSFAV